MYGEYLAWRGIDAREVESAAAAVYELAQFVPHAIVIEERLPDSTGPELIRSIRRSRHTFDIPVILLLSDTFAIQLDEADRYGCDRIELVPLLPEALLQALNDVVGERARLEPARPFDARLFTREDESVWLVRTTELELSVAGPRRERGVYAFDAVRDLLAFQAEYEQRLLLGGFTLAATGDDRRSGRDRRRTNRPSVADRRGVE